MSGHWWGGNPHGVEPPEPDEFDICDPIADERMDAADWSYAQWERAKLFPFQNILVSVRRRPWYARITPLGWKAIAVFTLAALALVWGVK